jgi:hypothetical protein
MLECWNVGMLKLETCNLLSYSTFNLQGQDGQDAHPTEVLALTIVLAQIWLSLILILYSEMVELANIQPAIFNIQHSTCNIQPSTC